jgi:fumarate hydratase subunit alpha
VVKRLCIEANRNLPPDVCARIRACREQEPWPVAQTVLDNIIANFERAALRGVPICQDTGMACVFLEIGDEVYIDGDLSGAIHEGVRQGYHDGYLRASVVADPLRRDNTGDNTPAMVYLERVPGGGLTVTVAPKGFGSENMSQTKMLRPSDGIEGVIAFVIHTVNAAGPNPCPPIVVGVGIGGTFDKAALIAKKALLRPLGSRHADPYYAELEARLLTEINALGIGPQGFGGKTTALAVAVETLPTHIAGLPCAVNINCHVTRHATAVL